MYQKLALQLWTCIYTGMTEFAILCSAYNVECHYHYDGNLGFLCVFFRQTTQAHFRVESPAFFSWLFSPCCQMHSTPAVRAILPAFYMVPALKRAQQSHGESAANRCNVVWTTPGLCGIIYHFHFLCYTDTASVNKQNIHKGERSCCSSAHILKLQQQWCVCVLSCEGKPSLSLQARLSAHVSGRKTQMWSWRQRKGRGGGGGWRD